MDKQELRNKIKALKRAMTQQQIEEKSQALGRLF